MSKKAKVCYLVDVFLFLAGLACALSGFVLMAGGEGGFRGGRNAAFSQSILGVARHTWETMHEASGIAITLGVLVHILLHWRWLVYMTANLFKPKAKEAPACPPEEHLTKDAKSR